MAEDFKYKSKIDFQEIRARIWHPPLRNPRFWVQQVLLGAALAFYIAVARLATMHQAPIFGVLTIFVLLIPVAFSGRYFGLSGAFACAVELVVLGLSVIVFYHPRLIIAIFAGTTLTAVFVFSIVLGVSYERQRVLYRYLADRELEKIAHLLEGKPFSWKQLIEEIPDGVIFLRPGGIISWASDRLVAFAGTTREELLNQPIEQLLNLNSNGSTGSLIAAGNMEIPVDIEVSSLDLDGTELSMLIVHDARPRLAAQSIVQRESDRFRLAFDSNTAGMFILDSDGCFREVNQAFCRMLKYDRSDLLGQPVIYFVPEHERDQAMKDYGLLFSGSVDSLRRECHFHGADGQEVVAEVSVGVARETSTGMEQLIASVRDVTEERVLASRLAYQASHDPVCDLPNRWSAMDHLKAAIARAKRRHKVLALAYIDLDDFKPVNDHFGHAVGDMLLREFAGRMKSAIRASDTLARLGGDEFVLVVEDLSYNDYEEEIAVVLERLSKSIEDPIEISGQKIQIAMSAGLAIYPFDAEADENLLHEADAALYQAKAHKLGRNRWWWMKGDTPTISDPLENLDPWSPAANEILSVHDPAIKSALISYSSTIADTIMSDPLVSETLSPLGREALYELVEMELDQFEVIAKAGTDRAVCREIASDLGTRHALLGVFTPILFDAMTGLRSYAISNITISPYSHLAHGQLVEVLIRRAETFIKDQLKAIEALKESYEAAISEMLPIAGTPWRGEVERSLQRLGQLAGIKVALVARPNANGIFVIEHSAGELGSLAVSLLNSPGKEILVDPGDPRGRGFGAEAWRAWKVVSGSAISTSDRHSAWSNELRSWSIHSLAAVPIQNGLGQPVALLLLYGTYPNQFESKWIRHWLYRLKQYWEGVWTRTGNA